jgi:hypothetical protein
MGISMKLSGSEGWSDAHVSMASSREDQAISDRSLGASPRGRSGRQTKSGAIRADVPDWVLVTGAGKAHAELQSSAGVVELDV